MELAEICARISKQQRERVFAIKSQSRQDRSVESYVRVNYTDWRHDLPEAEREAENAKALAIIKAARDGSAPDKRVAELVTMSDEARKPIDKVRKRVVVDMEKLAKALPVWEWAETVQGFGATGLAIIVAETTTASAPLSLSSYVKGLDGIYSRLGFAPWGRADSDLQFAGSTWKRPSWTQGEGRPTADEWSAHPFAGSRYAEMYTLAESLFKAQIIGKEQKRIKLLDGSEEWFKATKKRPNMPEGAVVTDEGGTTRPDGPYGEVYCRRRAHTAVTHPEWTPKHAQMDAMRVMFKALIADLYAAWMRLTPIAADGAKRPPPDEAMQSAPRSAATPSAALAA